MSAVPVKNQTSTTVKGLRTALPGRVGGRGDTHLGSDHNKRRWRSEPLVGSRDRIRTVDCPGRSSSGCSRIDPGAGKRRHRRKQAVWRELDSLRRSGIRVAECAGPSRTTWGNRDLKSNIYIVKELFRPAAVVSPRIQLKCPADALQVQSTHRDLGGVRGGKLNGLQVVGCSAAQHAENQQRASQRGKESFKIHRRVPPIGNLPHRRSIRHTRQGNQSHCTARA
jgi:hypothetical protein